VVVVDQVVIFLIFHAV